MINGLVEAGALVPVSATPVISPPPPNVTSFQQNLSDEQLLASSLLSRAAKTGDFRVILIDGVPGSGKTEVYFQALAQVIHAMCTLIELKKTMFLQLISHFKIF